MAVPTFADTLHADQGRRDRLLAPAEALAAFFAGEATPIRYNPTDGDELADAERRHKRLEDLGQDDPEGGIGR